MTFVNQKVERLGLSVQNLDTQVGGFLGSHPTCSPSLLGTRRCLESDGLGEASARGGWQRGS